MGVHRVQLLRLIGCPAAVCVALAFTIGGQVNEAAAQAAKSPQGTQPQLHQANPTPAQKSADDAAAICDRLAAHWVRPSLPGAEWRPTVGECLWCKAVQDDLRGSYPIPAEVPHALVKIPEAIDACQRAVDQLPALPIRARAKGRYWVQLGRALEAAERQTEAMQAYEKAAGLGYAFGEAVVGTRLLNGRGAPKDTARGLQLLKKSAQVGDPLALVNLAGAYRLGEGVQKSEREAYALMLRSAETGYPPALTRVAEMLVFGIGVDPSRSGMEQALEYGRRAGEAGDGYGWGNAALAAASLSRFDEAKSYLKSIIDRDTRVAAPYRDQLRKSAERIAKKISELEVAAAKPADSRPSLLSSSADKFSADLLGQAKPSARITDQWQLDTLPALLRTMEKQTALLSAFSFIETPLGAVVSQPAYGALTNSLSDDSATTEQWSADGCTKITTIRYTNSKEVRKRLDGTLAPGQFVALRVFTQYRLASKDVANIQRQQASEGFATLSGAKFGYVVVKLGTTSQSGEILYSFPRGGAAPFEISRLTVPPSVSGDQLSKVMDALSKECGRLG